MRRTINIIMPLGLIAFGVYWTWLLLTPSPVEASKTIFLIGVFPAVVGALWLASNWFDI
jgi:hypothetical protein